MYVKQISSSRKNMLTSFFEQIIEYHYHLNTHINVCINIHIVVCIPHIFLCLTQI